MHPCPRQGSLCPLLLLADVACARRIYQSRKENLERGFTISPPLSGSWGEGGVQETPRLSTIYQQLIHIVARAKGQEIDERTIKPTNEKATTIPAQKTHLENAISPSKSDKKNRENRLKSPKIGRAARSLPFRYVDVVSLGGRERGNAPRGMGAERRRSRRRAAKGV